MKEFWKGIRHGIPIALGYLSVSFGFGILAVRLGFRPGTAVLISMTNLTSAGQTAGVQLMADGCTYMELAITQLVINLRYGLMGISLSQKLDRSFSLPHRMLAAYGITDEIFAVASEQKERLKPYYLYGMILIAFVGWSSGTLLGAVAGELLPETLTNAMGLSLYGMFLAIMIPPARVHRGVLFAVLAAAGFSVLCSEFAPEAISRISVIICAVAAALLAAWLFPVEEETP